MTNRFLTAFSLAFSIAGLVHADEKVVLREELRPGELAVVSLAFRAEGTLLVPQAEQKDKAQSFSAQGLFQFEEKIFAPQVDPGRDAGDAKGHATIKSLRYYSTSSLESVVDNKKVTRELRAPVRLVVAEVRDGRPFL